MTQALPVSLLLRSPDSPKISQGLWSDEPPLESDLHREQIDSLIRLIRWLFRPGTDRSRNDVFSNDRLRLFALNGLMIPFPEEDAEQRAERAEAKLARWAEKLREMEVDVDRLE